MAERKYDLDRITKSLRMGKTLDESFEPNRAGLIFFKRAYRKLRPAVLNEDFPPYFELESWCATNRPSLAKLITTFNPKIQILGMRG